MPLDPMLQRPQEEWASSVCREFLGKCTCRLRGLGTVCVYHGARRKQSLAVEFFLKWETRNTTIQVQYMYSYISRIRLLLPLPRLATAIADSCGTFRGRRRRLDGAEGGPLLLLMCVYVFVVTERSGFSEPRIAPLLQAGKCQCSSALIPLSPRVCLPVTMASNVCVHLTHRFSLNSYIQVNREIPPVFHESSSPLPPLCIVLLMHVMLCTRA